MPPGMANKSLSIVSAYDKICFSGNQERFYGVPPSIAPTMLGKGWYSGYHTIQNKSAIHTMQLYLNCAFLATHICKGVERFL